MKETTDKIEGGAHEEMISAIRAASRPLSDLRLRRWGKSARCLSSEEKSNFGVQEGIPHVASRGVAMFLIDVAAEVCVASPQLANSDLL